MRDCNRLAALGALRVHPVPEIFRIRGVKRRERAGGRFATEKDVSVEVTAPETAFAIFGRDRRKFIGRERGEDAGFVILFGRGYVLSPDRIDQRFVIHVFNLFPRSDGGPHTLEGGRNFGRIGGKHVLGARQFGEWRTLGIHRGKDAEIFGVVGDGVEVERPASDGHVETGRVLDRLALGKTIGVICGAAHIENVGIEAVAGVDVHVAEIGIALSIVARHGAFGCCACRRGGGGFDRRFVSLVSATGDERKRR